MTPCDGKEDSTEWCCGFNNTACCGTSAAITLTALGGGSTASAMKAMSSTASSLTASTSSTASSHSSSSLSTGAKAGIGVGVGLGGLSLLSLLAFLFHQRRKPLQASLPSPGGPPEMPATATSQLYEKPVVTSQLHEKPAGANSTRHELMDMSTEN
ncbi:hypothetical protein ASPZODRAFT_131530 [Penicilliopsis zonata CBS 506.65]|uniref:Mid2 domain-containing protein n=1 Tax=Penicilliopsis zonata CBS 506.65 TaxID=1073090 RepID=A0A1L9SLC6_9EURO|nr:hypothetical protein ASPZODRAFT_131530 [Penicilliopsis zonata CBS 506.65]OJJ47921.1 hypothetical protein ASPZODRAFT_131530 [Penicilliopsis zonata CBS 506.65]